MRRQRLKTVDGRPVRRRWGAMEWAAFVLGSVLTGTLARTGWDVGVGWIPFAVAVGYWAGLAIERKAAER